MPKRSTNFNGRKNRLTAGGLLGLMDALEIPAAEQRQIAERAAAAMSSATVEQAASIVKAPTLHEALAARGFTSAKESDPQRRTVYGPDGERLGSFTAHEAWEWLKTLDA